MSKKNYFIGASFFFTLSLISSFINAKPIDWTETNPDKIVDQWKDIFRNPTISNLFHLRGISDEEGRQMQPHVENLQQIGTELGQRQAEEYQYETRDVTFPATVIFPGNQEVKCDQYEFEGIKDHLLPTLEDSKFVLIARAWFNRFAPEAVLGVSGDYSGSWDHVMDPRFLSYWWARYAMKAIDYERAGFKSCRMLRPFGTSTTWLAPHHDKFMSVTAPKIAYYQQLWHDAYDSQLPQ